MRVSFLTGAGVAGAYGAARGALKTICATLVLLTAPWSVSVASAEAPVVIAALGDSLTHGYGLPPEEAFPVQLEAWLRARGHEVEVLNAGVSGDTTAGGLARLDWTLSGEVDAVIVELGGNDLLRGIDPAASRANLDGILAELSARGLPALIAGLPAPRNYGPDFKQAFDGMFPELAAEYGAVHYENFMGAITAGGLEDAAARDAALKLMQDDGIHPNREGVAAIVEDIGPYVERLLNRVAAGEG
ncbi:MAG: arylesterase [Pseudomonadota bacterium]